MPKFALKSVCLICLFEEKIPLKKIRMYYTEKRKKKKTAKVVKKEKAGQKTGYNAYLFTVRIFC